MIIVRIIMRIKEILKMKVMKIKRLIMVIIRMVMVIIRMVMIKIIMIINIEYNDNKYRVYKCDSEASE